MANKSIFITALAVVMLGGIALAQTQPGRPDQGFRRLPATKRRPHE